MLTKRTIKLGGYDTAAHGWTLASLEFPEPPPVTNFVDVPGRIKGPLDLSRALTDWPTYGSRDLFVSLEISTGDRDSREEIIAELINQTHGQRKEFVIPDRPNHYGVGLLTVTKLYNDHAHGAVEITGICEPWLYSELETVRELRATSTAQIAELVNLGAMPVTPVLTVTDLSVMLTYNGASLSMAEGTYEWPHLFLTPGEHEVTYVGDGTLRISYREAVLR